MFMITRNWIMIPQRLYYIIMLGGGVLSVMSVGLIIYGILKKKNIRYLFSWSVVLFIGVLFVILTLSQKIVGHMMVGGA